MAKIPFLVAFLSIAGLVYVGLGHLGLGVNRAFYA